MDFYRWIRAQWDRSAAIVALVLGIVALFLGWLGTSGKALPTEQIPYLISGGMFGILALGVAGTLWLSADLRDEWRKLDAIHRAITGQREGDESLSGTAAHAAADEDGGQPDYRGDSYGDGYGDTYGDTYGDGSHTIELPRVGEHGVQALHAGSREGQ